MSLVLLWARPFSWRQQFTGSSFWLSPDGRKEFSGFLPAWPQPYSASMLWHRYDFHKRDTQDLRDNVAVVISNSWISDRLRGFYIFDRRNENVLHRYYWNGGVIPSMWLLTQPPLRFGRSLSLPSQSATWIWQTRRWWKMWKRLLRETAVICWQQWRLR